MSRRLKTMLPVVMQITGQSELSLNGIYGGKHADFIDIKNAVIHTPEHFLSLWMQGYMDWMRNKGPFVKSYNQYKNYRFIRDYPEVREWVFLFLKRTFLRNHDALSKERPTVEEATIWIGHDRASYGLLVTPRFRASEWENDKSEIRHFGSDYWTIGHVLETGFVIPHVNQRLGFKDVEQYLTFFEHTLVRASGSPHEAAIAKRYSDYVRAASEYARVPLLIPELRYAGIAGAHQYRLDFCVIDPFTMERVGFELSPWSTHGAITGTKTKTQKAINEEAKANFESEMKKLKDYFKKYRIYTLVYTDTDLKDHDAIFADIRRYLVPQKVATQLQLRVLDDFLTFAP